MHLWSLYSWNSLISSHVRRGKTKEALQVFNQLLQEGWLPDKVTFLSILSAFAHQFALPNAKRMHTLVVGSGFESDIMAATTLIHMYGKCESLQNAWSMFEEMPTRNVISWNAMITACAQLRQGVEAIRLFYQMELEGITPTKVTFIGILSACASLSDLPQGERMHALIMGSGFEVDIVVRTALVDMYGKCGSLDDARNVFDTTPEPNVVSWTSMIAAYTHNGQVKEAFQLFSLMQKKGIMPNKITFISLLDTCASQAITREGKQIHALIVGNGFESDVVVGNTLVNMYGKCGCIEEARKVFDNLIQQDVVSWNGMISAYNCNGYSIEALKLSQLMWLKGVPGSKATFVGMVDACANQAAISEGEWIHSCIVNSGFESDQVLGNALVSMYSRCGSLEDAQRLFEKMTDRDTVTWNAIIAAYTQHGKGQEVLHILQQMRLEGVMPNKVTLINSISACASMQTMLAEGRQMHAHTVGRGLESSIVVQNALVHMYGKCGSPCEARRVFDNMLEQDIISYNAMILAYAENQQAKKALQVFDQMFCGGLMPDKVSLVCVLDACASQALLTEGKRVHINIVASGCHLDLFVGNALVNMYGKCNSLQGAWVAFDNMCERDSVTWNAIIATHAQHGQGKLALQLFDQMLQEGMMPDTVTFVSNLDACARQLDLPVGKQIHARIIWSLNESVVLGTALLKMYGNCGLLGDAQRTFDQMLERNLVSWNAMLAVYAQNRQGNNALQLFQRMQHEGITPDIITFVSIISACSHAGLVDEASDLFLVMQQDHGIKPIADHYHCIIDLLARAGRLDEAENLINKMPFEPTFVPVMTLLSACRYHVDVKRWERVAEQMFKLEPVIVEPYLKLSTLTAVVAR